tara:strand:+ start:38 stop:406 length:369 start_codon:yes stop_codon:yes gene_type:complete
MTIKLMLLKSGEDVIADVSEMVVGEEDNKRVIGYFLKKPCIVKMRNQNTIETEEGDTKRTGFEVSLFPWMPLSKEKTIPITTDWVITMVEPIDNLKEMYIEDILNHGQNDKDSGTDESTSSD